MTKFDAEVADLLTVGDAVPKLVVLEGVKISPVSNHSGGKNLNKEAGACLFWTTVYLLDTSGFSRVLEYWIRSSIVYSISKKLNSHSTNCSLRAHYLDMYMRM